MSGVRPGEADESPPASEPLEVLVEAALAEFIAACETGDAPDPTAFASGRPEIGPLLRERIDLYLRVTPLFGPLPRTATVPPPPESIGPYRILEELGHGGMGAVYLAEQETPIRRRVALKVIKLGLDTRQIVARFETEREALALMSHPNVARVLDAGVTPDGRPYFVMEHIPGVPVTTCCDQLLLSTRDRLRLFLDVCDAIQHAHQKGIIHRDIKPSNVLVMRQDGRLTPKVIDFGVAKATHGRLTERTLLTRVDQIVGTPEYMSPEQAALDAETDVDTRTDIYSLGVLLYEMLTGSLPFASTTLRGLGADEMRRRIREVDPPKPSTRVSPSGKDSADAAAKRGSTVRSLRRQLRGDLDWITMKSLEKDRARRYSSVSELAADIRRHVAGEPIEAGPPTAFYRVRKYVRRHRAPLAASFGLAAAAAVSLYLYMEARSARRFAEAQEALADRKASEAQESAREAGEERRRANDSAERERRNAEEARRERDKNARLADGQLLADALARADGFWPALPARIPEMEAWLDQARILASRLELRRRELDEIRARALPWDDAARQRDLETHPRQDELRGMKERLAGMHAEVDRLRAAGSKSTAYGQPVDDLERAARDGLPKIAALEVEVARRRTWSFDAFEDRWQHESLARLVSGLESLVDPNPFVGAIAGVEARLEFARTVEARTIRDRREAWDETIAAVARDPRFFGLRIAPQLGLVPLGLDPETGLPEFAHLQSGRVPDRREDGTLAFDADSAIVLVLIPGGTFRMGARDDEPGRSLDESPRHDVTLAAFFMSKFEMTQGQFFRVAGWNPSFGRLGAAFGGHAFTLLDPVESVTWDECDLVLRRQGLILPTEAQWEYAARAGTTTAWSTGDDPATLRGFANLADESLRRTGYAMPDSGAWSAFDDGHAMHGPVGSYRANPWGLHDVHGNVAEWCRDRFVPYDRPCREGDGERRSGDEPGRAQRGGQCDGTPVMARSAYRSADPTGTRNQLVGVRPARALEP